MFVQNPSGRVPRSNVYGPYVSPLAEYTYTRVPAGSDASAMCRRSAPAPSEEKAAVHVSRPSWPTLEVAPRGGPSSSGAEIERQARESDARRQSPLDADFLGGTLAAHSSASIFRERRALSAAESAGRPWRASAGRLAAARPSAGAT